MKEGDFGYEVVKDTKLFDRVRLIDNTLAWENITKCIKLPGGKEFDVIFQLDPIVVIENSQLDEANSLKFLANQIRSLRKYYNLTQEELGKRIGSNKHYISNIENQKTDLELKTLRKIIEVGFNKNIFIGYYDKEDPLKTASNSVLRTAFIQWAESVKNDLSIIEGIGKKEQEYLYEQEIKNTKILASFDFSRLCDILIKKGPISSYHYPHTWSIQACFIFNSDWANLIKLQRLLRAGGKTQKYSKIERLAPDEIKENIFVYQ